RERALAGAQQLRPTLHLKAAHPPKAVPLLTAVAAAQPENEQVLYQLSQALARVGRAEEARQWNVKLQRLRGDRPWFEDVTASSGIDFRHYDSATPQHFIPEIMGSGIGWIDYDNDGWLDLFCVQDGPLRPQDARGPLPTSKLYRNNGDGTFTDVTEAAGLARAGFGMGCAVGDFDNDGYDDLVVTYRG